MRRKKVLALVLTLALALSVAAGAAFTDQKQIKNTEAVDMCVALNIVSGYPDGSFKPEGNITRAEFCKMICVMLNGGTAPATATNATPTFSDVRTSANASWAEGFIEYCYAKGIVSGVGDGKFAPNSNITASEAAKMLLVAMGYNADVEGYVGAAWALKVNVQANQDGLYKDLEKIDTNAALTRDNAAQMVWNALQAKAIIKTSSIDRTDGSVTDSYSKGEQDLLAKFYKGNDEHDGILVGFTYNSTKAEWTYRIDEGKDGIKPYTSSNDYTGLYAQQVTVVYKEKANNTSVDSVYGIYSDADDCQVLVSGLIGDMSDVDNGKKSVKVDGTSYDLDVVSNNTPVYYFTYGENTFTTTKDNETEKVDQFGLLSKGSIYDLAKKDAKTLDAFKFIAVDYDADDDIDCFVVYPFSVGQVNTLNSTKIGLKSLTDSAAADISAATFVGELKDVDTYQGIA